MNSQRSVPDSKKSDGLWSVFSFKMEKTENDL